MQEAWAIREVNDEVIITSKQLGVNNFIYYGGPGISKINKKPLNCYQIYKEIIEK